MGICTAIGQMHPRGLTPASLYKFAVSFWNLAGSLPYFFCISCIFGCRVDIAFIECNCLNVTGSVISLTSITSTIIAMPKLPKKACERMTRKLSIGWRRTRFHTLNKPTVSATTIITMTMAMMIMVFLPNLKGNNSFADLALSVVIDHQPWRCSIIYGRCSPQWRIFLD